MFDFFLKDKLRDWAVDYLYRCDTGLFEFEKDYKNKKLSKKRLQGDRGYNQLQGKFHALCCLLQDFNLPVPNVGDRIQKRIKQHGGRTSIIAGTHKANAKTRGVSKSNRRV